MFHKKLSILFLLLFVVCFYFLGVVYAQDSCESYKDGDANCDNKIDLIDYGVWKDSFLNMLKKADFNSDGVVAISDFETWRKGYFNSGVEQSNPTQVPINKPEPTDVPVPTEQVVKKPVIKVIVLSYLDIKNGKVDASNRTLEEMRAHISKTTRAGVDSLIESSRYHGYKDSNSKAVFGMSVVDNKEFLEAIPPSQNHPPWNENVYRPDYNKILTEYVDICSYVDNNKVDQVWIWGPHNETIEPTESNMSMGTLLSDYWNQEGYGDVSNSERTNDLPQCDSTYLVFNYNYSRGLGELLEDHTHQLEQTLKFVDYDLFWNRFVQPYGKTGSTINHCGWTHYGPNSEDDYDWANERVVKSDCEDWRPDGGGQVKDISCHAWYGDVCDISDSGTAFKIWWMQNLPGFNNGLTYSGKELKNWWDFYVDFDQALKDGKSLMK
jgi:hypothetical protein